MEHFLISSSCPLPFQTLAFEKDPKTLPHPLSRGLPLLDLPRVSKVAPPKRVRDIHQCRQVCRPHTHVYEMMHE